MVLTALRRMVDTYGAMRLDKASDLAPYGI
jgi:hypothetical protein